MCLFNTKYVNLALFSFRPMIVHVNSNKTCYVMFLNNVITSKRDVECLSPLKSERETLKTDICKKQPANSFVRKT